MTTPRFNLSIDMDNAAFDPDLLDGSPNAEVARILRDLADRLDSDEGSMAAQGSVRDVNGNTVGTWTL